MESPEHGLHFYLTDWNDIYQYLSVYGAQIALWAVLSAVTVYRREISCNRSYHDDDDDDEDQLELELEPELEHEDNRSREETPSSTSSRIHNERVAVPSIDSEEKVLITEKLLEGAGLYCSGKPFMNFASSLRLGFDGLDSDRDRDRDRDKNSGKENATFDDFDLSAEDMLDRVGNYASLEPIMTTIALFVIWKKAQQALKELEPLSSPLSLSSSPHSSFRYRNHGCDPLGKDLPPDVHVHIASFLHPRDVVTLACVSKAYNDITHDPKNMTSAAIWKTLWDRDYSWIVFHWKIGKQALERSNCKRWEYNKDFYFLFGQSYLDYVLAGHNTLQSCLVGIHSNIYDITPFLLRHPGSPDTLMVHSGRDATCFFDDMGHSLGARKRAMSMCVVVNRSAQSDNNGCGLFPTIHTKIKEDEDEKQHGEGDSHRLPPRLRSGEDNLLAIKRKRGGAKINRRGNNNNSNNNSNSNRSSSSSMNNTNNNGGGTLHQMRTRFLEERERVRIRNRKKYSNDSSILGHEVNTYFDPFTHCWRIWYTDTDLRTIYLPAS
eukprot:jgi/Psemu1/326963/estExt_fgenesh1_pg.C_5080001